MKYKIVYCVLSDYKEFTSLIRTFSSLERAKKFKEWHTRRSDGNESFYIQASRLVIEE